MSDREEQARQQANAALGIATQQMVRTLNREHRENEQAAWQARAAGVAPHVPAAYTFESGDLQRITTTGLAVATTTTTRELVAQTADMDYKEATLVEAHKAPPAPSPNPQAAASGRDTTYDFF